jgi:hypothetical protein
MVLENTLSSIHVFRVHRVDNEDSDGDKTHKSNLCFILMLDAMFKSSIFWDDPVRTDFNMISFPPLFACARHLAQRIETRPWYCLPVIHVIPESLSSHSAFHIVLDCHVLPFVLFTFDIFLFNCRFKLTPLYFLQLSVHSISRY